FLLASRPLAPRELNALRGDAGDVGVYELEPLHADGLDEFAHRWLATVPDAGGGELADRFLREAREVGPSEVLSVPLLAVLAMIVFERDPDQTLPRYRCDLYERYLDLVLTMTVRQP